MSKLVSLMPGMIGGATWLLLVGWMFVNRKEASFGLKCNVAVLAVGAPLVAVLSSPSSVSTGGRGLARLCLMFLFAAISLGVAFAVLVSGEVAQIRRRKKQERGRPRNAEKAL